MRKQRIIMCGCITALVVFMVAGCGKQENQSNGNSQVTSGKQNDSRNGKQQGGPMKQDGSQVVQVTKVDGDTITAKVAETPQGRGNQDGGEKPNGTPPADAGNGEKPDETPPANAGDGGKGGRGGRNFRFSDETISIQVTSDTKITKGGRDSTEEATISDIQENSVLSVILNDDGKAESIQLMDMNGDDSQ